MKNTITKDLIRIGIANGQYPKYLYKYFRWNDYTKNTLRDRYLWFSEFQDFNDPFEGLVRVRRTYSFDEINAWLISQKCPPLIVDNNGVEQVVESMSNAIENAKRKTKVCCFTKRNDNLLMWAHYADQHKGICVKFEVEKMDGLWNYLLPVIYSDVFPICDYLQNPEETLEQMLRTKSNDWKYEEEWRSIQYNSPQKISFDSNAISEVIMGCRFNSTNEIELRSFLPKRVKLSQAIPSSTYYKLEVR